MSNSISYDTSSNWEYKKGYREGFQDGYLASQRAMLSPLDQKACICGNTGKCNCNSQLLNEVGNESK